MSTTMVNPFSSASLSRRMAQSIPRSASPQLKNAVDVLALAVHASMLAVDFRLIGLGEEDRIEASSETSSPSPLPSEWNGNSSAHSFRYAHAQSSMDFLLKISKMGSKVVVMGLAVGDDKTCNFDVAAKEYVLENNLPSTPFAEGTTSEEEASESIVKLFIAYSRLSDFGILMLTRVIQKLAPGTNKGGSNTESETESSQSSRQQPPPRGPDRPAYDPLRDDRDPAPARPYPFNDPLAIPPTGGPRRPLPEPIPGFEDEFETQRPPRGGFPGGAGFPRIGDRDLYPAGLGPNDPMRGGVGPGLGPMGGGGMHPTFDDPLFAGQGQRGRGYDPQNPPGSRYDPVGPGMGGHPRGAGMGGRPPNPFGGFGDGDFL